MTTSRYILATAVIGLSLLTLTASAVADVGPLTLRPTQAVIRDATGHPIGSLVAFPDGMGKTRVTVAVRRVPAGWHGFHLHDTGVCDPWATDPVTGRPAPFASAGGHLDLTGRGRHGAHSGDLPPLLVSPDGSGTATFTTDRFRVAQLTDENGSAVILHAAPDNLAHIPDRYDGPDAVTLKTGDAGDRLGCGVLR